MSIQSGVDIEAITSSTCIAMVAPAAGIRSLGGHVSCRPVIAILSMALLAAPKLYRVIAKGPGLWAGLKPEVRWECSGKTSISFDDIAFVQFVAGSWSERSPSASRWSRIGRGHPHASFQDSGGGDERPRTLAELLGVDAARGLHEPPPAQPREPLAEEQRASGGVGGLERASSEWWGERDAGSPQAAHTPRALVPANCFPPQPSRAYASYSESARPGGWSEGPSALLSPSSATQSVSDLVASLKALSLPGTSQSGGAAAGSSYQPYEEPQRRGWPPEAWQPPAELERPLMRRASFCGSMSPMAIDTASGAAQWRGFLAPRCTDLSSGFSPKLFLGGLPWDINEATLMHALRSFHPLRVEWPGREAAGGAAGAGAGCPRGYAYVTLESERWVRALLAASRRDRHDWYYRISSRKIRCKEVQVIPWALADSSWSAARHVKLDVSRTVFVGALHGMLCARALAIIMNDLFHGVVFAGIDTDKNKYPIGSGRVMFDNTRSYLRAVSAAYVEIRTEKFTKRIQVDPYLEDSICSICNLHQGPYFCRDPACFRYYCRSCWAMHHQQENHKPLMRNLRGTQLHFPPGGAAPQMPSPYHNGQSALYDIFYTSRALTSPPPTDYSLPSTSNAQTCMSASGSGEPQTERAGSSTH
ncbi:Cytoplasmic polyadenylation element-binding protein 1-A [Eumeta japonica]|uniref:Cytoplasmic polyadenylation element-binding protein 1-A n=1 Tax=Eumeta variegata TaxID=151549 RepID=A0A4C1XTW9_EUMVA|nr:Cytoplasmic polyadenylation element-binding protein 1-A [Eumeta japonica]